MTTPPVMPSEDPFAPPETGDAHTRVARPPGPRAKAPEDENGFGYVLWLILGGEQANMRHAAELLQIQPSVLSDLLSGKRLISLQAIEKKKWREVFAAHYSKGWKKFADMFEERAKIQSMGLNMTHHAQDLHVEVGGFIRAAMELNGKTIMDILPHLRSPLLKKIELWEKIITCDKSVKQSLLKSAIREICAVLGITEENKRGSILYNRAENLSAKCG